MFRLKMVVTMKDGSQNTLLKVKHVPPPPPLVCSNSCSCRPRPSGSCSCLSPRCR